MPSAPDLLSPAVVAAIAPHAPALCNACLGRLAARLEPGLGNPERGSRLRAAIRGTAPPSCSLCEGLLRRVDGWADLCAKAGSEFEHDTFLVGSVVFDEVRQREKAILADLVERDPVTAQALESKANSPPWSLAEWLKTEINREVGRLVEQKTGKKVRFDRPDVTYRVDTRFDHVSADVADLFAKGRYRKFVRDLPQTRWPCRACGGLGCRQCFGSGKTYESSVEELVAAPAMAASGAAAEAFHGMGREDIDARTLGTGRPFVLELKRPRRRSLDWTALQSQVNATAKDRVEVEQLQPANEKDAARFKAADPAKTYHAACRSDSLVSRDSLEAALAQLAGARLDQRTPQRVSHRRADLVRNRTIRSLRLLSHAGDRFTIEIRADSGTYIKEFVSGDEGRTHPSLAKTLGMGARVEELDVVDVDWRDAPPAATGPAEENA
jgi:tRNA pseudouridine synthase 10